jgi:hypothetical protein
MKLLPFSRTLSARSRDQNGWAESKYERIHATTRFANVIRTISVGRLTLGLYSKDSVLPPTTIVYFRFRSAAGKPEPEECIELTIRPTSDPYIDGWKGPEANADHGYFLALTDAHGNVILVDDLAKADAERVMDLAEIREADSCNSYGCLER